MVDICNYSTSRALRQLTEEFISSKLFHDMELYETISTEKERVANERNRLSMLNKSA